MCEEQTIKIEGEELIRVSIPMPKKILEFLREYGEWIGYPSEEMNDFMRDYIIDAVETLILGDLDNAKQIAPLKVEYFKKKFKL